MINTGYSINPFQKTGYRLMQTSSSNRVMTASTSQSLTVNTSQFSFSARENTWLSTRTQGMIAQFDLLSDQKKQGLTVDNTPLSQFTPEKAASLVSDDGYYGVAKTSQRIADFVLSGAGDDMDRLKQGRRGILQGFEAAEKAWGGKLPDISYDTIEAALKSVDDKISELGGNILETSA
ncbi:MAG: hydrogenase-4 component G [Desulfobacterium sp.]|nr:hydrogenase-4 component G [Desulfobacterium sp.]